MNDSTVWGSIILAPIVLVYVYELIQDKKRKQ